MTHRFLCANHRQWLQSNPAAANAHFADTQDTGQWYREQGLWQQALPYVGCAYETAEIVLTLQARDKATCVINFTSCAILLADTWHKAGEHANSSEVLRNAQQRLVPEHTLCYQQPVIQDCIRDCIKALARGEQFKQDLYLNSNDSRLSH
ncbi:hypothetical protein [Paraglaciecola hydrolytica]|uniref:Uncharacterized protein n=1 Tax=Paraglaciecola hydrolytica TaxID=1799789 RepID=A0A136A3Q8_9ALTE|nr:hypothetical protein [Paraglaciecola hydrolytica]KXI29862.1 hypothetical protein AX660_07485 [Paraglaciecola hydrolytica]